VPLEGKSPDAYRAIERLTVDIAGNHSKYPKEITLSQKAVLTNHNMIHALSNSQKAKSNLPAEKLSLNPWNKIYWIIASNQNNNLP